MGGSLNGLSLTSFNYKKKKKIKASIGKEVLEIVSFRVLER